jgi:hypothetical protein
MQPSRPVDWQSKLTAALRQDPQKTGVLGVLALILVSLSMRALVGHAHPATAAGAAVAPPAATAVSAAAANPVNSAGAADDSIRAWLNSPIPSISRNDFRIKSDHFPPDTTKNAAANSSETMAKSLSLQADQNDKREAAIEALKADAAALRPSSIVMGSSPRAMINGELVREGDSVAGFRVLRIEARGVVLENMGIRLAVPME